jgi:hypothetical protein
LLPLPFLIGYLSSSDIYPPHSVIIPSSSTTTSSSSFSFSSSSSSSSSSGAALIDRFYIIFSGFCRFEDESKLLLEPGTVFGCDHFVTKAEKEAAETLKLILMKHPTTKADEEEPDDSNDGGDKEKEKNTKRRRSSNNNNKFLNSNISQPTLRNSTSSSSCFPKSKAAKAKTSSMLWNALMFDKSCEKFIQESNFSFMQSSSFDEKHCNVTFLFLSLVLLTFSPLFFVFLSGG